MSINKSKNALPLIGSTKQVNKNNSSDNKIQELNNYQNTSQAKIELKGKIATSRANQNKIIKENFDQENSSVVEKDKKNYKLINIRNTNRSKQLNTLNQFENQNNNISIINEIEKNDLKHYKLIPSIYKIIFVFRNEDFYLTVKENTTIKSLRLSISKLLNIDINQISMVYEEKEIDISNDEKTVELYFNIKKMRSRPIIYIKKKHLTNSMSADNLSNYFLFKKIYNNKVKIINFPSEINNNNNIEENLNNIIHDFFKNNSSIGEGSNENELYKIENHNENLEEQKNNNVFIIGFSSPDLAFDFNRYLNSLRLINPVFKDLKSNIILMKKRGLELKAKKVEGNNNSPKGNLRYGIDYILEENNLNKMNSNILKLIRNNYLKRKKLKKDKNNSQIFVNVSGPYLSLLDKERQEEKEKKKKWISPEGFISCVGKYSGIQL